MDRQEHKVCHYRFVLNVHVFDLNHQKNAEMCPDIILLQNIQDAILICNTIMYESYNKDFSKLLVRTIHEYEHPLLDWCRSDIVNFYFLTDMLNVFINEYQFRFREQHKSKDIVTWLSDEYPEVCIDKSETSECIPLSFYANESKVGSFKDYSFLHDSNKEEIVRIHRLLFNQKELHLSGWTNRTKPSWCQSVKLNQVEQEQNEAILNRLLNNMI